MSTIHLIMPGKVSPQLKAMARAAVDGHEVVIIYDRLGLPDLRNKKILFACELDSAGYNIELIRIMSDLSGRGPSALKGSAGAVLVRSSSDINTKNAAQDIIFNANMLGCRFLGHPLVEDAGNLKNFRTWQKQLNMPLDEICLGMCKKLGDRLSICSPGIIKNPNILALHSSSRNTSNTLELWHMVSSSLHSCNISELQVENGEVLDCIGCPYKTCIHFSNQNSCFYGGAMVKNIQPAIEKADALVFICPNYNDSVSANLTAVINRLTALYRKISFYNKSLFAVIVSGNSGSDSVARQLVGALNINKGFALPPYFCIMATANDPYEIESIEDICGMASSFAANMTNEIKA